eukprot:m.479524 g.479524  ORF g.479524 m.479524 type:complete len:62 (-) comp49949_c0_seq1:113-298(-)
MQHSGSGNNEAGVSVRVAVAMLFALLLGTFAPHQDHPFINTNLAAVLERRVGPHPHVVKER